jgi:hypothetical protein
VLHGEVQEGTGDEKGHTYKEGLYEKKKEKRSDGTVAGRVLPWCRFRPCRRIAEK